MTIDALEFEVMMTEAKLASLVEDNATAEEIALWKEKLAALYKQAEELL